MELDLGVTRDQAIETGVAAGVLLGGLIFAWLLAALLRRIVHHYTKATESSLDDEIIGAIRTPLVLLVVVEAAFLGVRTLSYLSDYREAIEQVWLALTLVLTVLMGQRLLSALLTWYGAVIARRTSTDWDVKSLPLIRRVLNVAVVVVGGLVILGQLGISISPLLAGLGLGGLAVALALQPLLTNIFASSYMLSDASIRVGDFIEMAGGPVGSVEDIGFRATRIRSFDNNIVVVPNSALADATVTNFTAAGTEADARVVCGVAYEEDLGHVERVCVEELISIRDEMDVALKDRDPIFRFQGFGDSNVDFLMKLRARSWGDSFLLTHVMVKRIHARLNAEGITINYPARRLMISAADSDGLERLVRAAQVEHGDGRTS